MDTNKKITLPHPNNSTLIFQRKITTPVRPPKNLNSLKNQHPSPPKKNLHDLERFHKTGFILLQACKKLSLFMTILAKKIMTFL